MRRAVDHRNTVVRPTPDDARAGEPAPAHATLPIRAHRGRARHAVAPRARGEYAAGEDTLVLGRYELRERLGAGGFGVVWRAHDELLRREVAVKRIALPTDEDGERAAREAQAAARLSHPAIVALYEACTDEHDFYLISELVEGPTLAELIDADALADEEVLEIGIALCDALAHAHARGVVHRDVKPQNVLLPDPDPGHEGDPNCADAVLGHGRPAGAGPPIAKLTDFGGAQLAGEDPLTRTGDVFGTLAYMSPEQCDGAEAGPPADVYALALVLYEALTGVNPVRAPTPAATVRRIGRALPPLARQRGELPRALTRTLDCALSPAPERRPALDELRATLLDALAHGEELSPRRARGRHRVQPPGPRPARASRTAILDDVGAGVTAHDRRAAHDLHGPHGFPALHDTPEGLPADARPQRPPHAAGWLTLPRLLWLSLALGLGVWQASAARPGVGLLALCAVLPLVVLVRRPGPGWLALALAPTLGLLGLAGAFPALAGQPARWTLRALAGALGYCWLRLAEPLLDPIHGRLWLGAPATGGARTASTAWEASLTSAATHALAPILTLGLVLGALLWAAAAVLLPWLVRGASAMRDALAAIAWAVALAAATPPLVAGLQRGAQPAPRGLIAACACAAALAIGARAVRGRIDGAAGGALGPGDALPPSLS
jgi:hypothetical protein